MSSFSSHLLSLLTCYLFSPLLHAPLTSPFSCLSVFSSLLSPLLSSPLLFLETGPHRGAEEVDRAAPVPYPYAGDHPANA